MAPQPLWCLWFNTRTVFHSESNDTCVRATRPWDLSHLQSHQRPSDRSTMEGCWLLSDALRLCMVPGVCSVPHGLPFQILHLVGCTSASPKHRLSPCTDPRMLSLHPALLTHPTDSFTQPSLLRRTCFSPRVTPSQVLSREGAASVPIGQGKMLRTVVGGRETVEGFIRVLQLPCSRTSREQSSCCIRVPAPVALKQRRECLYGNGQAHFIWQLSG